MHTAVAALPELDRIRPDQVAAPLLRAGGIGIAQLACELVVASIERRVDALAGALKAQGVKRGDRVAILDVNSHRYAEAYYACAQAGMTAAGSVARSRRRSGYRGDGSRSTRPNPPRAAARQCP